MPRRGAGTVSDGHVVATPWSGRPGRLPGLPPRGGRPRGSTRAGQQDDRQRRLEHDETAEEMTRSRLGREEAPIPRDFGIRIPRLYSQRAIC